MFISHAKIELLFFALSLHETQFKLKLQTTVFSKSLIKNIAMTERQTDRRTDKQTDGQMVMVVQCRTLLHENLPVAQWLQKY